MPVDSRTASRRPALVFALVGVLAAAAFASLPNAGTRLAILALYPSAAALAVLWGVRRNRPAMRRAWLAMAAGLGLLALGDLAFVSPWGWTLPSLADAIYVAGYGFLFVAAARFARAALPPESGDGLDATIIATALGLILWQALIEPSTHTTRVASPAEGALAIAYPLFDIVIIAILLPLVVRRETRTGGAGLLLGAFVITACSDAQYGAQAIAGQIVDAPTAALGWILGYVVIGAIALHPSWSDIGAVRVEPVARLDLARTLGVSMAALVPAAFMAWDSTELGDGRLALEGVAGLFLTSLVVIRLNRTVRQLTAAESRFRQFMAHPGLLVSMKDERGGYRFLNPPAMEASAAVGRAWLGQTDRALLGEDAGAAREASDATVRAAGAPIVTTERRGARLWHTERFPIQGLPGWVGEIGIDITDRERAVERQRVAEAEVEARDRRIEQAAARHARERSLIADTLRAIRPTDTIEATAAVACRSLIAMDELGTAGVVVFEGSQGARVLAIETADQVPVPVTVLTTTRTAHLRARAELGPWVERWVADPSHPYDGAFARLRVSAQAFAPLVVDEQVAGLLIVGSGRRDSQSRLTEWLPAFVEFAGIVSALLGPRFLQRSSRARLAAEIRSVVDSVAFRPVFQPIVDLESGAIAGYEALTRFDDGVPPEERFAAAQLAGLGTELELATLERALDAARDLPAEAWIDVNVSPAAVHDPRLRDIVHATARGLMIEITEHEEIRDYAAFRAAFQQLDGGAQLCVDDAGAGFASLRHVVELGPALVKLDRSLVAGIDRDSARQAVVAGMVHFADAAGIRLVAEGIERSGELQALRALGVRLGQGFLLGRPAPAEVYVNPAVPLAARGRAGRVRPARSAAGARARGFEAADLASGTAPNAAA